MAIIGYGSQGHAHALNLKDSGVKVQVGLPPTSRSRAQGQAAGLDVDDVAEAAKWADVIMILVPDTTQAALYSDATSSRTSTPGKMLMFAHGFNIRFGTIEPPARRRRDDGRAEVARAIACASCSRKAAARPR